ncbi:MAG: ATP-binding cassette domain-containing protein [Candidatus Melainabacteria bacterium]|nr:ATP-binding cassette domain-containing protein [Candidatus Melainabacteria bacterium]
MIHVSHLIKTLNSSIIVDDISFSVNEGETFVLLGKSGCGKTTTLKMINRLIELDSGQIIINGRDINQVEPEELRKKIGYVIQNIGLFPHYTVEENVSVIPRLLDWDKKKIKARVHELLELLGLDDSGFLSRYPHELSGGQKQRVGIARALAGDPKIVLLDEPFGALDPITKRQIQKEFKHLESLIHKTMILVTHDVLEAFELGDKICLMNQGKIEQIGTSTELIFSPKTSFVKSFFESFKSDIAEAFYTLNPGFAK